MLGDLCQFDYNVRTTEVRTVKCTASLISETEIATDKYLQRSQIRLSSSVLLSTVNF